MQEMADGAVEAGQEFAEELGDDLEAAAQDAGEEADALIEKTKSDLEEAE